MRTTKVKAKNIKIGDRFEGRTVLEVKLTAKDNISIRIDNNLGLRSVWRRRPAEEMVEIERPT